jgi:hypothetical protein
MGFISHSFLSLDLVSKKYKKSGLKSPIKGHSSGHSKSQAVVVLAVGGLSDKDIEDYDEHPVYDNSS